MSDVSNDVNVLSVDSTPVLVTRSFGSHRATDQGFHAYQMLETVVRQFTERDNADAPAGTSSLRSPARLRPIHRQPRIKFNHLNSGIGDSGMKTPSRHLKKTRK